jgi:hypothetical protein
MPELSPLLGAKRKLDFRSVFDPQATFSARGRWLRTADYGQMDRVEVSLTRWSNEPA